MSDGEHKDDTRIVRSIEQPKDPLDKELPNYVKTTKYTFYNFVPKNLFEQFHKKANVYFLIITILSFTDISPKTWVVSLLPLLFVLFVSMVKEAYEYRVCDPLIRCLLLLAKISAR